MAYVDKDGLLSTDEFAELAKMSSADEVMEVEQEGKVPRRVQTGRGKRWRKFDVLLWDAAGRPERATFEALASFREVDHLRQVAADLADRASHAKARFYKAAEEAVKIASNGKVNENG